MCTLHTINWYSTILKLSCKIFSYNYINLACVFQSFNSCDAAIYSVAKLCIQNIPIVINSKGKGYKVNALSCTMIVYISCLVI